MTAPTLNADQVAALVAAAKEGQLPEAAPPSRRAAQRARSVDFTRPTKFSAEQERKLRRAVETFARTASTRLAAELRVPVEFEVIQVAQLTWSHAHAEVPADALCAVLQAEPLGTRMVVSVDLALVLVGIERQLGNPSTQPPRKRRLSDIDLALARRLLDSMVDQLSAIWGELVELELAIAEFDTHAATAQVAPTNEPTLAFTLEVRADGTSSTVGVLVPWRSIEAVVERLSGDEHRGAAEADERAGDAIEESMRNVEVVLRAEVGAVELTVEELLALRPGDTLCLGAPAAAGVTLFSGMTPVHRAKPGRSGARRAVQVLGPAEEVR